MLRAIASIQRVETRFGVLRTTVYVLRNKYQATGLMKDRPRLVRQRVTKRAQDLYLRIAHLRNLVEAAVNTADEYVGVKPISRATVSRHFRPDATIKDNARSVLYCYYQSPAMRLSLGSDVLQHLIHVTTLQAFDTKNVSLNDINSNLKG